MFGQDSLVPGSVQFRDTTLREGIQVPGSRVSFDQKQAFVDQLVKTGVTEIEIGLPDGVNACVELAELIRREHWPIRPTALIPCYTSGWQKQVDQAVQHGIHRIDVLTPTSDFLLNDPSLYGMRVEDIGSRVDQVVTYARATPLLISVALMDATRAPLDRLEGLVRPLKSKGVSRLTVYDSVGCMIPSRMTALVASLRATARLPILVHCHNDYGMATANTVAAVEGGAEFMDVAVNGLGGRSGNAPLEEVALALENLLKVRTGLRLDLLRRLAQLGEAMTGLRPWPLKPILGAFSFAHVPVMHIRCIAGGNPPAFEPFDPRQVGGERTFDFALPVDYTVALEPFFRKAGCDLSAQARGHLLDTLKARCDGAGWTEEEIIGLIRQRSMAK